jgi:hypothetical protein
VRASIVLFVLGEALTLGGVALWSIPLALILAGIQCVSLALLREGGTESAAAVVRRPAVPKTHRRPSWRKRIRWPWPRRLRMSGSAA